MRKLTKFLTFLIGVPLFLGAAFFNGSDLKEANAANVTVDFTLTSADSVTTDGITVSFKKNGASTDPTWYTAGLRLYAKNQIEIKRIDSYKIVAVSFDWEKQGTKAFASVTASGGNYTHPSSAGTGTWSGSLSSVTFTLGGSGQLQLNTFSVTYSTGSTDPSITIDSTSSSLQLNIGDSHTYTATKENAPSAVITWSSSNTNVATIDSSTGVLNAIASGESTITATITVDSKDYSDSTKVNVLFVEPSSVEATITDILNNTDGNGKKKFVANVVITGFGEDGLSSQASNTGCMHVKDTSANDLYCYYSTGGEATKLEWNAVSGIYTYTCGNNFTSLTLTKNLKIGDQISIECIRSDYNSIIEVSAKITATLPDSLVSISVTPSVTEYDQGDSVLSNHFSVVGTYTVSGNVDIDSTLCTISPSKLDTAGDNIEITISYGGQSAKYNVKVKAVEVDISSIVINDSDFVLLSNKSTAQLDYDILPSNHTEEAVFASSDISIATVSQTGLVTYVSEGTVTITLTGSKQVFSDSVVVTCKKGACIVSSVTDTLTRATTGISSGSTSYASWSGKKCTSTAVYAGNSAGSNNSIQLRSTNNSSGVVTTSSCGNVKSITVTWESHTSSGRTINIYGKNAAYTDASDLYSSDSAGTLLGSITNGTSTSITITDNYSYFGIRSSSGALYLSNIVVLWDAYTYATVQEIANLESFMVNKLHMTTYDPDLHVGQEGDNWCKDSEHHYYADAKDYFLNTLTAAERSFFYNDTVNTQYANAKARLNAWAVANGETLTSNSGNITLASTSSLQLQGLTNDSGLIFIIIVVVGVTIGTSSYLIFRKKKHA